MHRRHMIRSTVLAVVAAFVFAAPVAAGDFRTGQTATVAGGETVDDDLYIGAGTVTIDGTVNGDATIGAGTVTVNGTVTGSLNVAGGVIDVLGDVEGAVRVSGGTVRIAGAVGRDLLTFGGTTTIQSGAEIAGDVAGGGGTITIAGAVGGDVLAGAGTLEITGSVEGSVDTQVGDLVIGPDATIGGDVTYTSSREARIADGATIDGTVSRNEPAQAPGGGQPAIADNPIVSYLGILLGLLLLGFGLLLVRSRLAIGTGSALRTAALPSLGWGLVTCIGQFLLIVFLIIAAVLFALLAGSLGGAFALAALIVSMLIVILIFVSAVPVAMAIGQLVLARSGSPYLQYLVGAAILALALVAAGFLPILGAILFLLVWILGLGAFVVYLWRTRNEPLTTAMVAPADPGSDRLKSRPAGSAGGSPNGRRGQGGTVTAGARTHDGPSNRYEGRDETPIAIPADLDPRCGAADGGRRHPSVPGADRPS